MSGEALTLERLRADIVSVLPEAPDAIGDDENLLDLGLDSIRIMMLAHRWTEAVGRPVEFAVLAEEPILSAWLRYLTHEGP